MAKQVKPVAGPYDKYRNPDPRCRYPFSPEPLGYCWGYATLVDERASKARIRRLCQGCEYWKWNAVMGKVKT